MIGAHLENLLFLLLVALAALFQLLAKTAGKTSRGQTKPTSTPIPRTPTPMQRTPTESDEDRIRKLMEALGQPPASRPPPPVVPRIDIPPRTLAPVQPPISPLSQLRRLRKREVVAEEMPLPRTVSGAEGIATPKITSAPVFEVHEGPSPLEPQALIEKTLTVYSSIVKDVQLNKTVAMLISSISVLDDHNVNRANIGSPHG